MGHHEYRLFYPRPRRSRRIWRVGLFSQKELGKLSEKKDDSTLTEWLKSMQVSIENTNKALNEAMRGQTTDVSKLLQANTKQLNDRLDTAARVIGDLKQNLGKCPRSAREYAACRNFAVAETSGKYR